jgi:hypothetical protein
MASNQRSKFHFNNMLGALESQDERIAQAFNLSTVRNSLRINTSARNKLNEHNALEEQSERNAEIAVYIANLNGSPEEYEEYIKDPDGFVEQLKEKLARKENRAREKMTRRSNRDARRAVKKARSMNRNRGYGATNNSLMDSPRRTGGTRRRTRKTRKTRKSRK